MPRIHRRCAALSTAAHDLGNCAYDRADRPGYENVIANLLAAGNQVHSLRKKVIPREKQVYRVHEPPSLSGEQQIAYDQSDYAENNDTRYKFTNHAVSIPHDPGTGIHHRYGS